MVVFDLLNDFLAKTRVLVIVRTAITIAVIVIKATRVSLTLLNPKSRTRMNLREGAGVNCIASADVFYVMAHMLRDVPRPNCWNGLPVYKQWNGLPVYKQVTYSRIFDGTPRVEAVSWVKLA